MSKQIEPLPCPFCGQLPTVQKWHGGGPRKTCVDCDCQAGPSVTAHDRATAVRRWNTRTA